MILDWPKGWKRLAIDLNRQWRPKEKDYFKAWGNVIIWKCQSPTWKTISTWRRILWKYICTLWDPGYINNNMITQYCSKWSKISRGSEQVKQLLHRKSEAESAKNLAIWQIYPVFFLAASPEILLFLPPWKW